MRNTFFLLLFLISGACFSQNPDPFWDGIRTKLVQPDTLSTFDRDALTPKLGTILYHKDTGISQWEQWDGTAWVPFTFESKYSFVGYEKIPEDAASISESKFIRLSSTDILLLYRYDEDLFHINNTGSIHGRISEDNGVTWGADFEIFDSVYDDRNYATGTLANGNHVIFFRQYDYDALTTIDTGFITSSDGITWSSFTSLGVTNEAIVPFGRVINRVGSDVLVTYGTNKVNTYISADSFSTRTETNVIDEATRDIAEPVLVDIGSGNSIMYLRNTDSAPAEPSFYQYNSADGLSFTFKGATNILDYLGKSSQAPVSARYTADNDFLEITTSERHSSSIIDSENYNANLVIYYQDASDVFTNEDQYVLQTKVVRPDTNGFNFYGYPDFVEITDDKIMYTVTDRHLRDFLDEPLNGRKEQAYVYTYYIYKGQVDSLDAYGIDNPKVMVYNQVSKTKNYIDYNTVAKTGIMNDYHSKAEPISTLRAFIKAGSEANMDLTSTDYGVFDFGNNAGLLYVPTIANASPDSSGMSFISRTSDSNTDGDMVFNARELGNVAYSTLTRNAYLWRMSSTTLMSLTRSGNLTISGTLNIPNATFSESGNLIMSHNLGTGLIVFRPVSAGSSSGQMTLSTAGNLSLSGTATATSFIKSGGTSTQYLMADGSTKNEPYLKYVALLTQSGTSAPTATVLENTLGGAVTTGRTGVGTYTLTLGSAFTLNKTVCFTTMGSPITSASTTNEIRAYRQTSNNIIIQTTQDGVLVDGNLTLATIEVRVYP